MFARAIFFTFLLLVGGSVFAAESLLLTRQDISALWRRWQNGEAAAVYALMWPHRDAQVGFPGFDALFGLAALDSGHVEEAVAALERAVALQPDNLPLRTELARAYEQLGDGEAAFAELEAVQEAPAEQVPQAVRKNLKNYVSVLDERLAGGPQRWRRRVGGSVGFDSNVNHATDARMVVIPAYAELGPATLLDAARQGDSWYVGQTVGLDYVLPVRGGKAWFFNADGESRQYRDMPDYQQSWISGQGGLRTDLVDDGVVTLGGSIQQYWFGGSDYSKMGGMFGLWELDLQPDMQLVLSGNLSATDYALDPERNDWRGVVGGTVVKKWPEKLGDLQVYGGGYMGRDETFGGNDIFSHRIVGLRAGAEIQPDKDTAVATQISVEWRDYHEDYPLFLAERRDRQVDVSVNATRRVWKELRVKPSVGYRQSKSNIPMYQYDRWVAEIGMEYRF